MNKKQLNKANTKMELILMEVIYHVIFNTHLILYTIKVKQKKSLPKWNYDVKPLLQFGRDFYLWIKCFNFY